MTGETGEGHKIDSVAASDGVELAGEYRSPGLGLSPRVLGESSGKLGVSTGLPGVYTGALGVY